MLAGVCRLAALGFGVPATALASRCCEMLVIAHNSGKKTFEQIATQFDTTRFPLDFPPALKEDVRET